MNPWLKDQRADVRWVMAYGHKTQSLIKTEVSKSAWIKPCIVREFLA